MMAGSAHLQAQEEDAIVKYFSKYVEQEEFTSIFISRRMIDMLTRNKRDNENPKMRETLKKLGGLRMLSADSVNGQQLYQEIFGKLNQESYEELMSVRESDGDVKFLIKEAEGEKISELLMLVGGDDSFFMLSIIGISLDLDSVMDIAEDFQPKEEEPEDDPDQ